jgi:hypothetical protein
MDICSSWVKKGLLVKNQPSRLPENTLKVCVRVFHSVFQKGGGCDNFACKKED